MPDITADTGAFDRTEVRRSNPGERGGSWRIEVRRPGVPGRSVATTQHLSLTWDELVAVYDHVAREVMGL